MMDENTIIVPSEERIIVIAHEDFVIEVPGEHRIIEVQKMALLKSLRHTAGDTRRWTLRYNEWLRNTATIVSFTIASSSVTCTVNPTSITILGREVEFLLHGGVLGETLTLTSTLTDDLGNIKTDTIAFTVVAP
jgi:hypothetical protein